MRRRRAPLARAVQAARGVLALRGIRSPEEIDLEALLDDHRIVLRRAAIGNAEGRLVRSGRRGVMTIDDGAFRSEKWRFVAAHELGHFLLHERRADLACFPRASAGREEKSRRFLDEEAASGFGVELLAPADMVLARYAPGDPPLARARALAAAFRVSLPTAALRVLDFTDEPCAVAYAERGTVRWCTATRSFGVTVPRELRLPEGSGAGERRVAPSVWGDPADRVREIHEHSVALPPLGLSEILCKWPSWATPREGNRP